MKIKETRSLKRTFWATLVAIVLLTAIPLEANVSSNPDTPAELIMKRAKWAGTWDYTVQDVPPEYSKGVLHVTKKKRVHMVQLELPNGTLDGENVVVKKKELNFSISIEGQTVDVSLSMDGDTFSGESSSPDGVFPLEGTRRK
ncbi:hypothetical protein [Muriicola sp. Z0-33]|uniref:hypothetical protein n=1 Tax=Muriicola sp. Z0-33 TaxID=2816957 RepID=UPI0022381F3E|nr:hypothetical protein [Muriicola sp. Z0-33]MCW5518039.1 hypothetical protein [Muriicola sp. Z0-33]